MKNGARNKYIAALQLGALLLTTLNGVPLVTSSIVHAAPSPACVSSLPSVHTQTINEAMNFSAQISNSSADTGYGPTIEVILPSGVFLNYVKTAGGTPLVPLQSQLVSDNDAGDVNTGIITNTLSGESMVLPVGDTYMLLQVPAVQLQQGSAAQTIQISTLLDAGLTAGAALPTALSIRCGFSLGATPQADQSADSPVTGAFISSTITPTEVPSGTPSDPASLITVKTDIVGLQRDGVLTINPSMTAPIFIGDQLTLRLQIQKDDATPLHAVDITNYLPLGLIPVTQITSFTGVTPLTPTAGDPNSVPTKGQFAYGNNTRSLGSPLPTPVLTTDAGLNIVSLTIPDDANIGDIVEVLYTTEVTDVPAYDKQPVSFLSDVVAFDATSAVLEQDQTDVIALIGMPNIVISKGVIATDDTGASYLPINNGPVTFSAMADPLPFSGTITSTDLDVVSIDSDLINASGGSNVRYAFVIENIGSAPAYNVTFSDSLAAMHQEPGSVAEANIRVLNGGGVDKGADATGGLFGQAAQGSTPDASNTALYLNNLLLEGLSTSTNKGGANAGENIAIISYDLALQNTTQPLMVIPNTGVLARFTAKNNGINHVTNSTDFADEATVSIGGVVMDKRLLASQVQDLDHTDITAGDVTVGELVRYQIEFSAPEGNIIKPRITDMIPDGLAMYKPHGIVFNTTCGPKPFNGVIPPAAVPGAPPFPVVASHTIKTPLGTTGIAASGEPLVIEFNSDIIVTPDGDPDTNTFCMEYELVVLDLASNNGLPNYSTTRTNSAAMAFGSLGQSIGPVSVDVNIVEPELYVSHIITPPMGQGGDRVLVETHVQHTARSSADAFDVQVTNGIANAVTGIPELAEAFIVDTAFGTDGLDNDGDGAIDANDPDEINGTFWDAAARTFTWSNTTAGAGTGVRQTAAGQTYFEHWPLGESAMFSYYATIDQLVIPNQVVDDNASVIWDSVPAAPITPVAQRVSAAGTGTSFRIRNLEMKKTVKATNNTFTGPSTYLADTPFLAVGEEVTFLLEVVVPNSTMYNLTIADIMPRPATSATTDPDFFRIDRITEIPTDVFDTSPTITISDSNGNGTNDQLQILYTEAERKASAVDPALQFEVKTTVLNNTETQNLMVLRNNAYVYFQDSTGTWSTPEGNFQDIQIVDPELTLEKTSAITNIEAGDIAKVGITFDHSAALSGADAFDLSLIDALPLGMKAVGDFATDGLDNDGDGVLDAADPDEVSGRFYDEVSRLFTWDATTSDNTYFVHYPQTADAITIEFNVQFTASVAPGVTVPNDAEMSYTSMPGIHADEKTKTVDDRHNFIVDQIVVEKSIARTSLAETGSSIFDAAVPDLVMGEEVTYQIAVTIPESTTNGFTVTDTLPPYFEALSGEIISTDGITHQLTTAVLSDTNADTINDTVTFSLGTVNNNQADADTEQLIFEVTARVQADAALTAGTGYINTASVTYTENIRPPYTATASADILLPSVVVEKTNDPLQALPGDDIQYTVVLTNNGNAPAYALSLADPLTAALNAVIPFDTDGRDNNGDTVNEDANETDALFYDAAADAFVWDTVTTTNPLFDTLLPGQSITLRYLAELDNTVAPATNHTNTAVLTYYSAPGGSTGTGLSYTSDGEATVTVPFDSSVIKSLRDSLTDKRIGDIIPYMIELSLQEGAIGPVSLTDTLPAGLAYVPDTFQLLPDPTITTALTPTVWDTMTPESLNIVGGESQVLTLNLGDVSNSDTDTTTDEKLRIAFDVVVLNTSDNSEGTTKQNNATVNFNGTTVGPALSPVVTIHEPPVTIDISTTYTEGSTVTYTVSVINNGTHAEDIAYDLDIWALIPPELIYTGNLTLVNGPSLPTEDNTILPNVRFQISEITPVYNATNPYQFTFTADVIPGAAAGSTITIPVDMPYTSQPGSIAGGSGEHIPGNPLSTERTGDSALGGGKENDYKAQDTVDITLSRVDLSSSQKTVTDINGGLVEPGDILRYRIEVVNSGNVSDANITVTDDLPLHAGGFTWIIAPPATAIDNSNTNSGGANGTGYLDITNIALDAMANAPANTLILEYELTIAQSVTSGKDIINNFVATPSSPAPSGIGSTSKRIQAPQLVMTKQVYPGGVVNPGTALTYTISVRNDGNAASTGIVITDPIPLYMSYVPGTLQKDNTSQTDTQDGDHMDFAATASNAVTASHPQLDPGDSFTITFSAKAATVSNQVNSINTASLTDNHGSTITATASVVVEPEEVVFIPTPSPKGSSVPTKYTINYGYTPPTPTPPKVIAKPEEEPKVSEPTAMLMAPPKAYKVLITHTPNNNDLERIDLIPQTGGLLDEAIEQSRFADVTPLHSAYMPALELLNQGFISANAERNIALDDTITRAQAAKLVALAFKNEEEGIPVELESPFTDVVDGDWSVPYLRYVTANGLMKGYGNGTFGAADSLTLSQAAVVLTRAFGITPQQVPSNAHWADGAIASLRQRRVVTDELVPEATHDTLLTRGQFFTMFYRILEVRDAALKKYYDTMTITVPSVPGMVDIPVSRGMLSEPSVWKKELDDGAVFYQYKQEKNRGKFVLFGHSFSNPQYAPQKYSFTGLINTLAAGQRFMITIEGITHEYEVTANRVIPAEQVNLLASFDKGNADMVLFTCDTKDTSLRHTFEAKRIDSYPAR